MTIHADPPAHEVRVVDGRFIHAECTCGWRSAGRRTRSLARTEAHDHALLYADGRGVPLSLPEVAIPVEVERTAADA
jgi:hypothetical protein